MLSQTVKVDIETWQRYRASLQSAPSLMAAATKRAVERIAKDMRRDLKAAPPRPKYPIQWTSERQRRYVMALLRRTNNLPYRRTGALVRGWHTDYRIDVRGGLFTFSNKTAYAGYVQGPYGSKARPGEPRQQRFHRLSGWPSAPDVAARYRPIARQRLRETWVTVSDPFGGIRHAASYP